MKQKCPNLLPRGRQVGKVHEIYILFMIQRQRARLGVGKMLLLTCKYNREYPFSTTGKAQQVEKCESRIKNFRCKTKKIECLVEQQLVSYNIEIPISWFHDSDSSFLLNEISWHDLATHRKGSNRSRTKFNKCWQKKHI